MSVQARIIVTCDKCSEEMEQEIVDVPRGQEHAFGVAGGDIEWRTDDGRDLCDECLEVYTEVER